MANQITDNRTLVNAADSATNFVDLTGGAAGTLDTEIFIEGTGSIGEDIGSSLKGILYNMAATPFAANEVVYLWINCGIVGLLDTKANGGFRIRFTGSTVTDWFEVYVAGSDEWPPSVQGGWTQFVVDVTEARAIAVTNGWTNGTTPAVTAVQRVGWAGITGGTMPRMVDNTWLDAIWRLPADTPGLIIEGSNAGTTPWNWADVLTEIGDTAGIIKLGAGGAYVLNTPVQFGINDTSDHEFEDTNIVLLWEDAEFINDDFYKLSAIGNVGGTTNVTAGIKTGTGNDATGAQGWFISAAETGARWNMDFSSTNLNLIGLYGCTFAHGDFFDIARVPVECINTQYLDCRLAFVGDSTQLRVSVVNSPNTNSVATFQTHDMSTIAYSTFESGGAGHAIELTNSPARVEDQESLGNTFTGYSLNDGFGNSQVFNDSFGLVNLDVLEGANISVRNGTSASTVVSLSVPVTVTVLDEDQNPIEGATVYIVVTGSVVALNAETNSSGVATGTFSGTIPASIIDGYVRSGSGPIPYNDFTLGGSIDVDGYTQTAIMSED